MDRFEDVNEGISKRQLFKHYNDELGDHIKELPLDVRQKRMFASCWFYGKRESVAMWNLYASSSGVAISLPASALIAVFENSDISAQNPEEIGNAYYGPVFYKDFLDPNDIESFKEETRVIGFQKDKSFEHENEYRFLLRQRYADPEDAFLEFVSLKLESFGELPFELIFHPKMPIWQKENIAELVAAYEYDNFQLKDSELRLQ